MPSVNAEILKWARETSGLSLDEAAAKLDIGDARGKTGGARLAEFEQGIVEPTRPLLLRMSKQYRRPLLTFYMTSPPKIGERGEDFRTLPPEHSTTQQSALVDALIRDIRARQQIVRAALEDEDEAAPLPFVASMTMKQGAEAVLQSIKEALDLDLERYRGKNRLGGGFAYLRERAESAGIYVLLIGNLGSHHTNLDVETFRGFALADNVAPFVIINDQDAETAWAFTLLHELTHIWLGQTGVSGASAEAAVEQFCNEVAAKFFIPPSELGKLSDLRGKGFDAVAARINEFAEHRNISRSMVAYKLFLDGIIPHELWHRLSGLYRSQWKAARVADREKNRDRDGGPNYYVVRRHRLGDALVALAGRMLADQVMSPTKAGKVLGVKPSNVYGIVAADKGPGPSKLALPQG